MSELKITLPYFNDPWMDNAVVNLYGMLKTIEKRMDGKLKVSLEREQMEARVSDEDVDAFEKQLWEEITQRRDNTVFVEVKDKETGGLRKVRKDFVLIGYDNDKQNPYIHHRLRDFYSEKQGRELLQDVLQNLQVEESERNHTCVLCGQSFHKRLSNLKQAIYPFVTKIKSISGIRSKDNKKKGITEMPENYKDVCPACYLAGILAWGDQTSIFRTVPGGYSLLLLPIRRDLRMLQDLRKNYENILSPYHRYTSLLTEPLTKGKPADEARMEFTSGQWSLLFGFTENFNRYVMFKKGKKLTDAYEMTCDSCLSMRIPSGQVKDIKTNRLNIDKRPLAALLNLILKQETFPYKQLLGQLYVMVERGGKSSFDNDGVNEVREALAEAFLSDDFTAFARSFVPRKHRRIVLKKEAREVLDKLIQEWRLKKMNLEKEHLKTLRSAGNVVAEVSQNTAGLLYRLDRTRNVSEFFNSLREISRKMAGKSEKDTKESGGKGNEEKRHINPWSLAEVITMVNEHETEWRDIKNLLLIYACVYHSVKKYKAKDKEGGKGE